MIDICINAEVDKLIFTPKFGYTNNMANGDRIFRYVGLVTVYSWDLFTCILMA